VLDRALRAPGSVAAFVELHIEQGPVLEQRGLPIGVVTHIVGIRRVAITVQGRADHAGTTPMDIRCDALVGAARLIDAAHQKAAALSGQPHYVVATVGRLSLTPNASNAVPGQVEMTLEVRSDHEAALDGFPEALMEQMAASFAQLRVKAGRHELSRSSPTACAPSGMEAVEQACAALGYGHMRMPSGAGHDAAYVAPCGPVGMVFIPCLNGRSHCPEEWTQPQQLLEGTQVLLQTVLELDRRLKEDCA
jgi:N-carbamoyl-L-amino-acid hydrolase